MPDNPPSEIQILIDAHVDAFNTQNVELSQRLRRRRRHHRRHRALSLAEPNAPANWLADVEKWRKDLGVTHERLTFEMGFWNVEGANAYAVIAGTLTIIIKGQTVVRTGTLAYTFSKHDESWKIDAQAWGRTS